MIDHFDLIAPLYDRLIGPPDQERLREALAVPPGGRVLDAGGGTGRVAIHLRDLAGEIVVLDRSAPMLRQARARDLDALAGDVTRLPFPDASFDRVVVVDALHHFTRPAEAIRELLRVLRPGGRLVIEEPDIRLGVVKLVALAERLLLMNSTFFAPAEIVQMIEACGVPARVVANDRFATWVVAEKDLTSTTGTSASQSARQPAN
ncbi:MAG: class I SAM-dependent methyltransferase [Chloroflexaceae bacterium]